MINSVDMATKKEKLGFTVVGTLFGATFNVVRGINGASAEKRSYSVNESLQDALIGGVLGGGAGWITAEIFGTPNDTVNYQLYSGKKLVYEGITYEDRIESRINEHERLGKCFSHYEFDKAKPRIEAEELEKKRIKEYKPKYNIQHR